MIFDELAGPLLIALPPIVCTLTMFIWLGRNWRGACLAGALAAILAAVVHIVGLMSLNPVGGDQGLAAAGAVLALVAYLPACLFLSLTLKALWRRR